MGPLLFVLPHLLHADLAERSSAKTTSVTTARYEQAMSIHFLRRATYVLMPTLVIGAIWFSVVSHYYISSPFVTDDMIEQGRKVPHDALLDELSNFYFFGEPDPRQTVEEAERILKEGFSMPGEAPRKMHLPFDSQETHQRSPLFHAKLAIPRILLAAYRTTGREDFFLMAQNVILGWASYERRAFLPKGLLWNDHAMAERILALADFWALYRHHPSFETTVAKEIHVFAARTAHFLADSTHFTGSTNHGVMQNLALWHFCLAFPSILETSQYREVALERLREQMSFYMNNEEGFVLEHSAEYHKDGVQFISMAFRYMSLLGITIPNEWQQKYDKAKTVYAQLRRPDGSLPMFGDTGSGGDKRGPYVVMTGIDGRDGQPSQVIAWRPLEDYSVYPIAGYSIWWDGLNRWPISKSLTQTVVAWSYFPGHAHKHADEMSVLLWARGENWWTSVGKWPYVKASPGEVERGDAISWNGSNAPHLIGEAASSVRTTKMLGHGRAGGLRCIDLERRGPRGYIARRQVVQATNNLWVIIDHTAGDSRDRTTTFWMAAHDIQMNEGPISASYELRSRSSESVLTKFISGSVGTTIRSLNGSRTAVAGWQVVDDFIRPATAIVVEQPANDSWSMAVWSLNDNRAGTGRVIAAPSMYSWEGPEKWIIALPVESGTIRLFREANEIVLEGVDVSYPAHLTLTKPAGIEEKIAAIHGAHERVSRKYSRIGDHIDYRLMATYVVLGVIAAQETFFAIYKLFTRKYYFLLRGLSVIAWVVLGLFLVVIVKRLI